MEMEECQNEVEFGDEDDCVDMMVEGSGNEIDMTEM